MTRDENLLALRDWLAERLPQYGVSPIFNALSVGGPRVQKLEIRLGLLWFATVTLDDGETWWARTTPGGKVTFSILDPVCFEKIAAFIDEGGGCFLDEEVAK
jgi:hypothetical protein